MDLFTIKGTVEQGTLVRDALCSRHNYQDKVMNEIDGEIVDNPETNTMFAKRMIMDYLKNEAKAYRIDQFNLTRQEFYDSAELEAEGIIVE